MASRRALRFSLALLVMAVLVGGCGPSEREREVRAANQRLERQVSDLQASLAAATQAREQLLRAVERASQERDDARRQLADAEAQAALSSHDRDVAQKELASARAQVEALTAQLTATRSEPGLEPPGTGGGPGATEPSTRSDGQAAPSAASPDPGSDPATLRAQLQVAQAKLVKASDDLASATRSRDAAEQARAVLEARAVEQAASAAALQRQLQTARAELATARAQLGDAAGTRDQLLSQLAAARDAVVRERQQRQDLQAELTRIQQRGERLAQSLERTADDLQTARQRAGQLTRTLESLLHSHQGLQQLSRAQSVELADVRRRLQDAQSQVARLTGARGLYTVQAADSLSSIAAFFYRDANRWPLVLAANAHLIGDPDLIFPGMVLILPEPSAAAPSAGT